MMEEEFKETSDEVALQLRQPISIYNRRLLTKTETTSQYWELANSLETREKQIVF